MTTDVRVRVNGNYRTKVTIHKAVGDNEVFYVGPGDANGAAERSIHAPHGEVTTLSVGPEEYLGNQGVTGNQSGDQSEGAANAAQGDPGSPGSSDGGADAAAQAATEGTEQGGEAQKAAQ